MHKYQIVKSNDDKYEVQERFFYFFWSTLTRWQWYSNQRHEISEFDTPEEAEEWLYDQIERLKNDSHDRDMETKKQRSWEVIQKIL